jgi:hypothetical protein
MSIFGKNALKLGIFLLGLFLAAALYVSGGLRSFQLYQQAYALNGQSACGAEFTTWEINPQALAAGQNSPPELVTSFYSNLSSLLTVRYRSTTPQQITLSVQIPNFSQEEPMALDATPGWKTQSFHPPMLPGMIDALANVSSLESQVILRVRDASGKSCEDSKPLRLLNSRAMSWLDPQGHDNADFLAGWVTPQDPAIRQLIARATQRLKNNPTLYSGTTAMIGYNGTSQDVINQVNAIYDTLEQDYHLRYSSISIKYGQPALQNIALPKDVLQSGLGICIETTVTMASAIESLNMRPFIYIIPGHAFLGVALGPDGNQRSFWETTFLGQGYRGLQANEKGLSEYNEYASQIIRVIDISAERQQNIWPME